jgi:hypothetical protein
VLSKIGAEEGKWFIIWTDNTTTLSKVDLRKSKNRFVNKEWKFIQHLLLKKRFDIQARRVSSEENRADALSRGKRENHLTPNMVHIVIAEDICNIKAQNAP